MRDRLAEYYLPNATIQIDGCYDEDTEDGQYDFYELWLVWEDLDGLRSECMNEGEMLFEWPTYEKVLEYWKGYANDGNYSKKN